jgi:hypothetical protein
MKQAVSAFLNYASATSLPNRDKAALLVFSRLIAFQLPLPSSPVEFPNEYYLNSLTAQANSEISEINESIVVDVAFLQEVTRKVWLTRYDLVYRPLSSNAHLLTAAILTHDDNAFSAELREVDVALSADGTLNRISALCLAANDIK